MGGFGGSREKETPLDIHPFWKVFAGVVIVGLIVWGVLEVIF
jgi:hypothetical protein